MTKKIGLVSSIVIFLVLALLAAAFIYYQKAYAGKVYRNVYIFNENISGKNIDELNNALKTKQDALLNQEFSIQSNSKTIKVKMTDTGVGYDLKKIAEDSFSVGRDIKITSEIAKASKTIFSETNLEPTIKTNQAKFDNFVSIAIDQLNNAPIDATLIIENGTIKETAGQNGMTVDISDLNNQIVEIFRSENFTKKVILKNKTVAPAVQSADFLTAK